MKVGIYSVVKIKDLIERDINLVI